MKRIFTTTLRLDMTDEEDRLAWSHLQQMDKKQYRSYSKAIVAAVNDYSVGRSSWQQTHIWKPVRKKMLSCSGLRARSATLCGLHLCQWQQCSRPRPCKPNRHQQTTICPRHWTLQTASDTSIAPNWYCSNTSQGRA